MSKIKRELSIIEVAQIKKHLLFKDMKQKEIASKFGVVPSLITKIKKGLIYKEVEIDADGQLIEEVVRDQPEDFILPPHQQEDKKDVAISDESTPLRVQFIENFFRRRDPKVNRYDDSATSIHYEPSDPYAKRYTGALYNSSKWLFNNEWDDFISQVMLIVTKTVMTYEPSDKSFAWKMVNTKGSKEYSSLCSFINKAIKYDLRKYANQINDSILVKQDGLKGYSKPSQSSLDKKVETEEGSVCLSEHEGVQSSFWQMKEGYQGSHFLDWYSQNHENILTKGQANFMNVIKYFQREDTDSYTVPYNQLPEDYKPFTQQAIEHNRRRIRDRVEEAYYNERPITLRHMQFQKEYQFWSSFYELIWIDDERIDEQNRLMTNWIKQRIKTDYISLMTWHLSAEDVIQLNDSGSEIKASTLYSIVNFVEERKSYLEELLRKYEKIVPFPISDSNIEDDTLDGTEKNGKFVSTPTGIFLVEDK